MKKYIASYQNKEDECWDVVINASSWRKAHKIAKQYEAEYGKLYSVRLKK